MSENTPTTSAAPAANSYAAFIPEIWSKKLSTMLEKKCVMLQCVNRNYEGEIAAQGDKVKFTMRFKGRELSANDMGKEVLNKLLEDLEDVCKVDAAPKLEGKQMFMIVSPA